MFLALVRFELTRREFDLKSAGRREYAGGWPADKGGERSRANRALSAISFIKAPFEGVFLCLTQILYLHFCSKFYSSFNLFIFINLLFHF